MGKCCERGLDVAKKTRCDRGAGSGAVGVGADTVTWVCVFAVRCGSGFTLALRCAILTEAMQARRRASRTVKYGSDSIGGWRSHEGGVGGIGGREGG
eukprot:855766-Rhodomonas_salina.1